MQIYNKVRRGARLGCADWSLACLVLVPCVGDLLVEEAVPVPVVNLCEGSSIAGAWCFFHF